LAKDLLFLKKKQQKDVYFLVAERGGNGIELGGQGRAGQATEIRPDSGLGRGHAAVLGTGL
jgi:hypothetical protein